MAPVSPLRSSATQAKERSTVYICPVHKPTKLAAADMVTVRLLVAGTLQVRCLSVTESQSGAVFPLVRTFWSGEAQRNLGAGVRKKKVAFVGVKVSARGALCPRLAGFTV